MLEPDFNVDKLLKIFSEEEFALINAHGGLEQNVLSGFAVFPDRLREKLRFIASLGTHLSRVARETLVATSYRSIWERYAPILGPLANEQLWLIGYSEDRIAFECKLAEGNEDEVRLPDRRLIVREAIRSGCTRFAMLHNHPGHIPVASPSDMRATDNIRSTMADVDFRLVDSYIIAGPFLVAESLKWERRFMDSEVDGDSYQCSEFAAVME